MKLEIEINNLSKCPVKKAFVKKVLALTLKESGYQELFFQNISLSLAWVNENEMHCLNMQYRKKDRATDVLSFCEYEDAKKLKSALGQELFLGELVLCYNYIQEVAGEKELPNELARIIAHGMLHLLCFNHGKKMFAIQDMVAENI